MRRRRTVALVGLVMAANACADDGTSGSASPTEEGKELAARYGCFSCHSVQGDDRTGPTWSGLAGSKVTLADGTTTTATRSYLEDSIRSPEAMVVKGFPPIMPTVDIGPEDLSAIIDYIQSLGLVER